MPRAPVSVELPDEAATLLLGRRFAAHVRRGDVLALSGELGAGKTTFARGLIAGLAERAGLSPEDVPSPSFPIVQSYEFGALRLWHFDLYRIEAPSELEELGFSDALSDGVVLIEWPEQAKGLLPEQMLTIRVEWSGKGRRAFLAGRLQSGDVAGIGEET